MGRVVAIDTNFLIDLQKSHQNARNRTANHWLASNVEVELVLPIIAYGEFLEGFDDFDIPYLKGLGEMYRILPVGLKAAKFYAIHSDRLRKMGLGIGANDLWIASICLTEGVPILTRNVKHFSRVEGLEILDYGADLND